MGKFNIKAISGFVVAGLMAAGAFVGAIVDQKKAKTMEDLTKKVEELINKN